MAVSILYPGSSLFVGGVPCKLFGFGAGFGATGPVPEARERPCDSFGRILRPWRPFWTHFGSFLMTLGQTDFLRLEHCDIGTVGTYATATLCVETRHFVGALLQGAAVKAWLAEAATAAD